MSHIGIQLWMRHKWSLSLRIPHFIFASALTIFRFNWKTLSFLQDNAQPSAVTIEPLYYVILMSILLLQVKQWGNRKLQLFQLNTPIYAGQSKTKCDRTEENFRMGLMHWLWFFQWSCTDVRVGLWRNLSAEELMLLNCGVGEDSWESLGLQGDPTSPS